MSKQDKARGRRRRKELLEALGNKCAWCGTTENLEFDCKIPQGDKHHRKDAASRMDFYIHQHRLKNVQILCKKHNTEKSIVDAEFIQMLGLMRAAAASQAPPPEEEVPF